MRRKHVVTIDESLCVGCGLCRDDCVTGRIQMENGKAVLTPEICIKCGHCQAICPENAISLSGYDEAPLPITPDMHVDADALTGQLKARRSVRRFTSREIAPELIERIIEAGRYTPTGSNRQNVSYTVIQKNIEAYEKAGTKVLRVVKRVMDVFSRRYRNLAVDDHFLFKNATAVIVIKAPSVVDGCLAASSMEMMAQSLGLGVFYSGFFTIVTRYSAGIRKRLGVRKGERVATTLVLGHPAVRYQRTAQREPANVIYD